MMGEKGKLKTKSKRINKKILMLSEQAIIKERQKTIKLCDLEVGDTIIIVGSSNGNGRIESKMVRVFPF